MQQIVKTNWVLTGAGSPQSYFGIQIAVRVCACWNRKYLRTLRCSQRKIKSVDVSNHVDAFDFALRLIQPRSLPPPANLCRINDVFIDRVKIKIKAGDGG